MKRNIKRSWMSAKNFNQFSVTSAWKNSWTQLFGSRSDWLILAAWLLPLSVIFLSLVARVPLAAFSVTGGDGADGACQSARPHHSVIVRLVHPESRFVTVALTSFCRKEFSYSEEREDWLFVQ